MDLVLVTHARHIGHLLRRWAHDSQSLCLHGYSTWSGSSLKHTGHSGLSSIESRRLTLGLRQRSRFVSGAGGFAADVIVLDGALAPCGFDPGLASFLARPSRLSMEGGPAR